LSRAGGTIRLILAIKRLRKGIPGLSLLKNPKRWKRLETDDHTIVGMITILSTLVSGLSFRFRSRASLELELLAIRHQVSVLRRQHKGRLRLFSTDRLLWVWLYRIWPRCLDAMVLVRPATVIQWHRNGFRLYWRRRSRPLGRPKKSIQIRDLIRRMSMANPLWGAPRIHECVLMDCWRQDEYC
jgi:hypothetical protein